MTKQHIVNIPGYTLDTTEPLFGKHSTIYRVKKQTHENIEIHHAIKVIEHPKKPKKTKSIQRAFYKAALKIRNLKYFGVVQIWRCITLKSGQLALITDWIEGKDLWKIINTHFPNKPVPTDTALYIGVKLAKLVSLAAPHMIAHGDIRPSHIMLSAEGELWLTDWCVTEQLSKHQETQSTLAFGREDYYPPERFAFPPEDITTASDMFSIATVVYRLLTGRMPFDSFKEILDPEAWPAPMNVLAAKKYPKVEAAIMQALNRDANQRPSAKDFAAVMEKALYDHSPEPIMGLEKYLDKWAGEDTVPDRKPFDAKIMDGRIEVSVGDPRRLTEISTRDFDLKEDSQTEEEFLAADEEFYPTDFGKPTTPSDAEAVLLSQKGPDSEIPNPGPPPSPKKQVTPVKPLQKIKPQKTPEKKAKPDKAQIVESVKKVVTAKKIMPTSTDEKLDEIISLLKEVVSLLKKQNPPF